jgi:oligoribonuclease (3'-5' exoribonuclease)
LTTLAWLAIEAAGPDPYRHPVLEAALVLTDWDLNEITTLGMMVKPDRQRFRDWKADMPPEYTRRHTKNRLTSEVGMFGLTLMEVESALVDTFKAHGARGDFLLAGWDVDATRHTVTTSLRHVNRWLAAETFDVDQARRFHRTMGAVEAPARKQRFRALLDARAALDEARYYRELFGGPSAPHNSDDDEEDVMAPA